MKLNKQKAIELISVELEKGSTYSQCLAVNGGKWRLAERTFDRYWKIANEDYQVRQAAIRKELTEQSKEAAKERLKAAILTKDERMEIASKIAKGDAWKVGKDVIAPTAGDRIRALDYLSKIDGDYAAVKKDITTNGESLNEKDSEDRFKQLLAAAREGIRKNTKASTSK